MSARFTSVDPGTVTSGVRAGSRPCPPRRLAGRAASVTVGAVIGAAVLVPSAHAKQRYESVKYIAPPTVHVTTQAKGTAPGLVFVAPKGGHEQGGPMIYDNSGNLVYFRPSPAAKTVLDFRTQTYQGKPVLTWWQGTAKRGYGFGQGVIYDQSYHQIGRVRAGNGLRMDFHDFTLTPTGTALIASYKIVHQDTRGAKNGEKRDLAMQNVVQEVDVATGKVLFQWNANRHISPSESYDVVPDRARLPYDYIHLNSVKLANDGNLLISGRATHAIYKVDRKTGKTIWRLGGKKSDFKMGKGTRTRFQHDAEQQADGTITAFDNNADVPIPGRESRGVQLRIDEAARTATFVRQWTNPKAQLSPSQGDLQTLPNNNVFIGWGGTARNLTEFSRGGAVRFEARFTDHSVDSYRAYRLPWSAQPTSRPSAVARRSGKSTVVHVSWNGATTVASWRVLGGASESSLQARKTVGRTGFETRLRYGIHDGVVAVEALDANGTVLSRSNPVKVG